MISSSVKVSAIPRLLLQNVEDEVIAIGFRNTQTGCGRGSILPKLRGGLLAFVPGLDHRRAAGRLRDYHARAFRANPAQSSISSKCPFHMPSSRPRRPWDK